MKAEEIRKSCPKCGGLTITDFSVNPPGYEVVVRNWCPDCQYELKGVLAKRRSATRRQRSTSYR